MSKLAALLVGMIATSCSVQAMENESKEQSKHLGAMTFSSGGVQRKMKEKVEARKVAQVADSDKADTQASSSGAVTPNLSVDVREVGGVEEPAESPFAALDKQVKYEDFNERDFAVAYRNALYCALFDKDGKKRALYQAETTALENMQRRLDEGIRKTVYQQMNTLPCAAKASPADMNTEDNMLKALFTKQASMDLLKLAQSMEFPSLQDRIEMMTKENLAQMIACRDMLNKLPHFKGQRRDRRAPMYLGGVPLGIRQEVSKK